MTQEQRIEYFMSEIARLSNQVVDLQNERDALKEQNAALAAQVEALLDTASEAAEALGFLSHHLQGRMGDAALMDMAEKADALNDALNVNPQQHLAEIRAEAGRAGFVKGYEYASYGSHPEYYADQYADSIRQEKK